MLLVTATLRSLCRPRPLYTVQPNTWHKHNRLRVYDSVRLAALKFLNDDVHPTTNDFDGYLGLITRIYQALLTA